MRHPQDTQWWEQAPLRDTRRRNLTDLHPTTLRQLVDHALGLARHAVRSQRQPLQTILGDGDDLDQQLTVWILEAAATYDPSRGPWGAHVVLRVRQLAGDHWRRVVGRTALEKVQRFHATGGHGINDNDRLHVSRALALLPGSQSSLDSQNSDIGGDQDADAGLALRSERTRVTLALLRAATSIDPARQTRLQRGLVIHILRHVHGYSQRNIAECGIHHRTAGTLENELRNRLRDLLDAHP